MIKLFHLVNVSWGPTVCPTLWRPRPERPVHTCQGAPRLMYRQSWTGNSKEILLLQGSLVPIQRLHRRKPPGWPGTVFKDIEAAFELRLEEWLRIFQRVVFQEGNNVGRGAQHERTQSVHRNSKLFWITESHSRGGRGVAPRLGLTRLKGCSYIGQHACKAQS